MLDNNSLFSRPSERPNIDVPRGSVEIWVDSRPSIEIGRGEEPTETESHIGSDGPAEDDEERHGDSDKGLLAERSEEVECSGWVSVSIVV